MTKIKPERKPHSVPLFNAWLRALQQEPDRVHRRRDLPDTILGGAGAGSGILSSVDLDALMNKASAVATLHSKTPRGREQHLAESTQTGLDTTELQWHTWRHLNRTFWAQYATMRQRVNKAARESPMVFRIAIISNHDD